MLKAKAEEARNIAKQVKVKAHEFCSKYCIETNILAAANSGYTVCNIKIEKSDYDCLPYEEEVRILSTLKEYGYQAWFRPSTPTMCVLEIVF